MEAYFNTIFEDIRHERSLILLLSLTDADILKQSKFTDDENILLKIFLLKNHTDRNTKRACRNGFVRKTDRR